MGFRCGIVGLPNVGKSTLFNALTETAAAQAANYPFCTIEPELRRSEPGFERRDVDEATRNALGIRCRKRKDDPAAIAIDMDREEAVLANSIAQHLLGGRQGQSGRRQKSNRDHHQDPGNEAIHRKLPLERRRVAARLRVSSAALAFRHGSV